MNSERCRACDQLLPECICSYPHRHITEQTREQWRDKALATQQERNNIHTHLTLILKAAREIIKTDTPTTQHINQLRTAINNHDQHTG